MKLPCRPLLLLALCTLSSGCAHTMLINPDAARLPTASAQPRAETVAYVMNDEQRGLYVTTPGGGGDKASYRPYHDLESALYRVLSNQFQRVLVMAAAGDNAYIAEKNVRFVFTPSFQTASSSNSVFTWPPTEFSLTIDIEAHDAQGGPVWHSQVTGSGHAEFAEFKHDFGLSAKRAAEDAFAKLQEALKSFPGSKP